MATGVYLSTSSFTCYSISLGFFTLIHFYYFHFYIFFLFFIFVLFIHLFVCFISLMLSNLLSPKNIFPYSPKKQQNNKNKNNNNNKQKTKKKQQEAYKAVEESINFEKEREITTPNWIPSKNVSFGHEIDVKVVFEDCPLVRLHSTDQFASGLIFHHLIGFFFCLFFCFFFCVRFLCVYFLVF